MMDSCRGVGILLKDYTCRMSHDGQLLGCWYIVKRSHMQDVPWWTWLMFCLTAMQTGCHIVDSCWGVDVLSTGHAD